MADDLVAELTLRLINETNAGVSEIRGELEGVATSAGQTADVLSGLTAELQAMSVPAGLADGFAAVGREASASIEQIGTAIGADMTALDKFLAEMQTVPNQTVSMADSVIASWQAIGVEIEKDITSMETF